MPLFSSGAEDELVEVVTRLVIQLGIILVAARLGGEVAQRYLRIPAVLGELLIGVAIGPFALGGVEIGSVGPLFADLDRVIPVSNELWSVAQIASIVLLFVVGLETDLRQFLRYAGPGLAVAAGGVALPFVFGILATDFLGFSGEDGLISPEALFIGAIMTATSVGITARVLSDLGSLHSAEGVTIIAAAVVDDVLAILVLTVVIGISAGDGISASGVGWVAFKAIAFWIALTGIGILLAPYFARFVSSLRVTGAAIAMFLALAFLAAGLAETFGLAFIIGAFSIGLALSRTDLARKLEEPLNSVYNALVPVFFVVIGMLVDVTAMGDAIVLGVVITLLAIVGKVAGAGLPALATGFNLRGSTRVGMGMLPRGEVALIIAGTGLSTGIIGQELFGVSILMTLVTTLIAPILLIPLFSRGGSGRRGTHPD